MQARYVKDFMQLCFNFFECIGSLVGCSFQYLKVYAKDGTVYEFNLEESEVYVYEKKKTSLIEG